MRLMSKPKSRAIALAAVVASTSLVFASAPVHAQDPADTLQQIIDDHWAFSLSQSPVFATSLGVRDYDDKLGSPSLESQAENISEVKTFLTRLDTLGTEGLTKDDLVNFKLLRLQLQNALDRDAFGAKYLLMSNRYGPHTAISRLPDRVPFFTKADFESYIARLNDVPRYLGEAQATLAVGASEGWVQPCEPMQGVSEAIRFHVVDDVDDSVLMKPFEKKPDTISERDWRKLEKAGRRAVETSALPAIARYADFYDETYGPACREEVGTLALPDGDAYYTYLARFFTTTERTPDDIHNLGLSEVARIRAEMMQVIDDADFDGDFDAFQEFLRTDPQFYAKTADELVAITSMISKKADGVLPQLFTQLPRMPYTVKPVPADIAEGTTTAYYERPAGDGSRAGVYRINTSLLDQRPLFELEALSLHEAVPGHHFQIALSQELTLPAFRRFGGFTAFTEGWGLYAESLGLDTGFYQDPYSNFGRLSYEMWRACRLVVDTGIHAKGWSKQQAIDFMAENTALSLHNIEAEVNRYITNPGQALAYKMGELKMQELRKRASRDLGEDFDLRRFHDALLENGAVPLSVLEENINAWIAAEKAS